MNFKNYLLLVVLCAITSQCQSQTANSKDMKKETNVNPLLCDPEKGFCEIPTVNKTTDSIEQQKINKSVRIIYFTDPICSSCWGIEPQLRKLKLEYGHDVEIEYRMGGLLPDWSYNSGGISKPSDVAHHWDEVSKYYDMPIDGDVWITDPLDSSYPPSIAFKAAQLQGDKLAIDFLRRIREMVFLEKKNITKWENLANAAKQVGLDDEKLKKDIAEKGKALFEEDLKLAAIKGVRGFPTLFVSNSNKELTIYGFKPYNNFEETINSLANITKKNYEKTWEKLFINYNTLTKKEFSVLAEISTTEAENLLNQLTSEKKLIKYETKNGAMWQLKK